MSVVSDFVLWILGGAAAMLAPVGGVVKRNRDRSMTNKRRLEGDENPDGYEGLMTVARDTQERVGVLEEKMDTMRRERRHEHEAVMDRIDEVDE